MAAILAGAALGLVVDQAAGHMKLMNQRQAGCVDPDALRHVRPQYAGVEAARRDLDRFHRWCDRENTLDEHVQGINNVALTYAPGVGLSLDAARDIDADATVFRVPPGMVLSGELSVVKETMGDRLSAEQLEMLELASTLSQAELHRDLSVRVLLWQLVVESHIKKPNPPATPNPSSGLEPWLRCYKLSTIHPRGWLDEELEWVSALPWAWHLVGSSDWATDADGHLCRAAETFVAKVLPQLREAYPAQLPESHFTPEGFEFVSRLWQTRNCGGLLVPLHDIMNHDIARQSVAFADGLEGEWLHWNKRKARADRCYVATATRRVSAGEPLFDTYDTVDDNAKFCALYDFTLSHDETFLAVDATVFDLAAAHAQNAACAPDDLLCEAKYDLACHPDDLLCELAEEAAPEPAPHDAWPKAELDLVDALRRVPEAALKRASVDEVGDGGRAHPTAVLGRAETIDGVATAGLRMLLEVCVADDPHAAVDALHARGWTPELKIRRNGAAAALLERWASQKRIEVATWLETRATAPPATLPAHRAADALRLADEAKRTLDHALSLLRGEDVVGVVAPAATGVQGRVAAAVSPE